MAPSLLVVLSVLMSLSCVSRGFMPPKATATEGPAVSAEPPPSVVLNRQGKVTGSIQKSDSGREYNAFFGIPFGTIPKRFMAPEPAGPFPEDFVADKRSTACVQRSLVGSGVQGIEDCLILNVFTPYLPDAETNRKLPVMVWIYGGAFVIGSVNPMMHGPSHLMEHDIVLVMMNYRVGIFGFLSTEDAASPGNYGLLDQNLALQWVQENVEQFGGDKNHVTISGLSAGGASVIYQILSPLSAGLFQNAISMSGSALCPWALTYNPLTQAKYVAGLLNCPTDDTYELVECLREATPDALVAAMDGVWVAPVIEPENGGKFLMEHPLRVLEEGRFNKVTLMTGITRDEMTIPGLYQKDPSKYNITKEEFLQTKLYQGFEQKFNVTFSQAERDMIMDVGEAYFEDVDFTNDTALEIADTDYLSDFSFGSPNDMTIEYVTAQHMPVYSYVFEYVSDITNPSHIHGRPDVGHGADFIYLYHIKMLTARKPYSEEAAEFVRNYVSMITNFVTSNKPTPSGELIWEPTPGAGADNHYMRLGTEMEMAVNPNPNKIATWNTLFKAFMRAHIYGN